MSSLGNESLGKLLTGADLNPAGIALPGNCTANTPPQFDNDTSIATTAFVQRALGNVRGINQYSANRTLDASDAGKPLQISTAGVTITLPLSSGLQAGTVFHIRNVATGNIFVACSGADTIGINSQTLTSIALGNGDSLYLVAVGGGGYAVFGGSAQLGYSAAFSSSLAASGYQRMPSGLIIQWGVSSGTSVVFPIAFPNAAFTVVSNYSSGANSTLGIAVRDINFNTITTTGFTKFLSESRSWIAIGH